MKKCLFILALLYLPSFAFTQEPQYFSKIEDSLKVLGLQIRDGETDFIKYNANGNFLLLLQKALATPNSSGYPFDSLKTIARLTSDDKKIRIFNWNLKKSDGTYEYFGFVQSWSIKAKKYVVYYLNDNSDSTANPETVALDPQKWYGAHYYKIIEKKSHGRKYYTLLGWDGNNKLSQKKIVEVIVLRPNGKPVFGASIFKYKKKNQKRVIFEYCASATMSLKYEKQYLLKGKKKRPVIIFDRLAPLNKGVEGQYEFYYPETNLFDAFLFKNGKWIYCGDIDARNKKETREEKNRRQKIIKEQKKHLRK